MLWHGSLWNFPSLFKYWIVGKVMVLGDGSIKFCLNSSHTGVNSSYKTWGCCYSPKASITIQQFLHWLKLLQKEHYQVSIWIIQPMFNENSCGITKLWLISSIALSSILCLNVPHKITWNYFTFAKFYIEMLPFHLEPIKYFKIRGIDKTWCLVVKLSL